jgi:hypothetical protein
LAAGSAAAAPPEYAKKQPQQKPVPLVERLQREVKPLKHARGKRWPMILWECVSFEPQRPEVYRALLERGLTQHVRLDAAMIPAALAIQKAGSPVILMEGSAGPWPASLAGPAQRWAHRFDPGYQPPPGPENYVKPCLGLFEGWAKNADRVRGILRKFQEAGVTVDAVWTDWEGDPAGEQFEQASHCRRCREMLPRWVLASPENCAAYCAQLRYSLHDAYLAAPVREIFPKCSVTNWHVVWSTPERPVVFWNNRAKPPSMPALMDANPIAYGNTVIWQHWNQAWPLDLEHVDQFYTHLLLREVSENAANMLRYAPDKLCIPWVARWCPDDENPRIPVMSRARYREVLRHLWLRGVDGMQVFNATRPGYDDVVFAEVADAVAVYDEMLAYGRYLDGGAVLCTETPKAQDDGVLWSGRRLDGEAVIRVFKQGGGTATIAVEPWPGKRVQLKASDNGETYLVRLVDGGIRAERR